jgi:RNA 2',3'-cyclic 3'-phosphodiesterase
MPSMPGVPIHARDTPMIRLFVGLPVPDAVASRLLALQRGVPGARWRTAEHFHITLCFIGEVGLDVAEEIDSALDSVRVAPFELALKGSGLFGGDQPDALWMGVAASEPLGRLQQRCRRACERAGARIEARKFVPHVTIAYLRSHANPDRIAAFLRNHALFESPPWTVDRFFLYSSHLGARTSSYTIEAEYPLIG